MSWDKAAVEALVHDLPLREVEKDQLREELWGHVLALYDEARAQGATEEEARQRACRQVGTPADLANAFTQCQRAVDRIEGIVLGLASHPKGTLREQLHRAARRFARGSLALLVPTFLSAGLPGMTPGVALFSWITITMLLALALFPGVLAAHSLAGWPGQTAGLARRGTVACAGYGAIALATWCAGFVLTLLTSTALDRWDLVPLFHVFTQDVYPRACVALPVSTTALWMLFRWRAYLGRNLADWPYREPGAANS